MQSEATIDVEQMVEQVNRLTNEVKVLRESIDELKTSLEHALRNGKIVIAFHTVATTSDAEMETDGPSAREQNETNSAPQAESPAPAPGVLF